MKRNRYLAVLPLLMTGILVTGCAQPISTANGMQDVYSAIEKIAESDYKEDIKTMVYYTKAVYNEPFSVSSVTEYTKAPDQEDKPVVGADFRIITDEVLTRIDFTDPDDMYYYNITARTFKYLTSYDNKVGTAGYTDTIVRFGYQFYKNSKSDNYRLEMVGSRGVEKAKSLKLENYPYINASTELNNIEALIKEGTNTFTKEQAKVLFDEFFTKIVEHEYRINNDIVNVFENDGTKGYQYSASDTSFVIEESGNFEFDYKEPKITVYDITISDIIVGEKNEESDTYSVTIKFSNNVTRTYDVPADQIPENLGPDTYDQVSEIEPNTNTWIVFGNETKVSTTDSTVSGSGQYVLVNKSAGLNKEQNITQNFAAEKRFWADTEIKQGTAEREVKMVYGNHGFLTSSFINDERATKEVVLGDCTRYYTSYYTTADFNVEVPHVYAKA